MTELLKSFQKIVEYYGETGATIILTVLIIVYGVHIINKNYSFLIKRYFENKLKEKESLHEKATQYRKSVTPKVRAEISKVAEEIGADRVLVFEYSNGSSNLIGLPFLYASATCEVVSPGTSPVSHSYQKINTSIVATFLEKLEDKGYFYFKDIEEVKDDFPILYDFMKPNKVKTGLFYTLVGVNDTIGFIAATTIKDNSFTREESLSKIACSAQKISSLLNFDELHKNIHEHD